MPSSRFAFVDRHGIREIGTGWRSYQCHDVVASVVDELFDEVGADEATRTVTNYCM